MPAVPAVMSEAGAQPPKAGDPGAKPSREERVNLLVKLVKGKGPAAVAQVQQKINSGQELSAKGITWDVAMLKEALAKVGPGAGGQGAGGPEAGQTSSTGARPLPTPIRAPTPAAAPAAPQPQSSVRWAPPALTASALARKVQSESEGAEPFNRTAKNTGENKVAVMVRPNVLSQPTGEYLLPGEAFEVIARCSRPQDGRTYLRLKKSTGWVCTRSRKDFSKAVVCGPDGCSLEAASFGELASRASQLLPHVDAEGRRSEAQGGQAEAEQEEPAGPQKFRVVSSRGAPILGQPTLDSGMVGAMLHAKEDFLADAVCFVQAEGRAYLRLKDGRGWVCERLRADFHRFAVEPADSPHDDLDAPMVRRSVVVSSHGTSRERAAFGEPAAPGPGGSVGDDAPLPPRPAPRGPSMGDEAVVLRSDSSLWPAGLGPPQPLRTALRVQLRRLANAHGEKRTACEEDLREVEDRAAAFARSCEGKKLLLAHAEVLRKELVEAERVWHAAVEAALKGADLGPPPSPVAVAASGREAAVVPVQVLGRAWHCAVLRPSCLSGESGEAGPPSRRLGPLRPDATLAAKDLQVLEAALEKALAAGDAEGDGQAPAKKPRRSGDAEKAEG